MYDDDLYSWYNTLTSTDTEEDTQSSSSYSPSSYESTNYNPYNVDSYKDDYSVTPNYEEQQSYNSVRQDSEQTEAQVRTVSQMHTPLIRRDEPAVVLTKTRQKIYLQARMKIIIAMFATIVCSLLFVSIFNLVNVAKLNASIGEKQITVEELKSSIMSLRNEYNLLNEDGVVKNLATDAGFVESNDSNTTVLNYGEVYTEPTIEELPSNWFNDVCDFFSKLFAA